MYRLFAPNGLGTALQSAVKRECEETLKFRLENGADRDKVNYYGQRPIDLACQNGFKAGVLLFE